VAAVAHDHSDADLGPADRAMLDYAVRLTRAPESMTEDDADALRAAGFDDVAIHDIAQVTALFNYYNRLADGLGIDPEPEHPPAGSRADHLAAARAGVERRSSSVRPPGRRLRAR